MQARKNLEYVRGTKDVDQEFNDLVEYAKLANQCKHPWKTLFSKKYRPQLILSACSTGFQQWTGYDHLPYTPVHGYICIYTLFVNLLCAVDVC